MKKTHLFFLVTLFSLLSCNKENLLNQEVPEKISKTNLSTDLINDSIIPLDSTKFPKKNDISKKSLLNSPLQTSINQLEGIYFYIQSYDSFNEKNTFQSNGKGQEVKLEKYESGKQNQLFYLKILPATSGIPYLIYSVTDNAPIGSGTYTSDPNRRVLWTKPDNVTSLFGFSWDFKLPTNITNEGVIIENQDVIGQGTGGPFDIFYHVLNTSSGQISFAKPSGSKNQQFNLVPNDDFLLDSVILDTKSGVIGSQSLVVVKEDQINNFGSQNASHTVSLSNVMEENYGFTESSGISTSLTGNINAGVEIGKILKLGASYSITSGSNSSAQYTKGGKLSITVGSSTNITVPPRTQAVVKLEATRFSLSVPYKIYLKGSKSSKKLILPGMYSGADYLVNKITIQEFPIDQAGKKLNNIPNRTYTAEIIKN